MVSSASSPPVPAAASASASASVERAAPTLVDSATDAASALVPAALDAPTLFGGWICARSHADTSNTAAVCARFRLSSGLPARHPSAPAMQAPPPSPPASPLPSAPRSSGMQSGSLLAPAVPALGRPRVRSEGVKKVSKLEVRALPAGVNRSWMELERADPASGLRPGLGRLDRKDADRPRAGVRVEVLGGGLLFRPTPPGPTRRSKPVVASRVASALCTRFTGERAADETVLVFVQG